MEILYKIQSILNQVEDTENVMAKRMFGSNAPTISELKNNVDMLFLNTYPTWEDNRPVPPSVVYMGGLHQKPKKELPTVSIFKDNHLILMKMMKDIIIFKFCFIEISIRLHINKC